MGSRIMITRSFIERVRCITFPMYGCLRMYEGDKSKNIVTAAIGTVNLVTKNIVDVESTRDECVRLAHDIL